MRDRAELVASDDSVQRVGDLELTFSEAVPHGPRGAKGGHVVMVAVRDAASGRCVVHTGDVMGPVEEATTEWIVAQRAHVVVLDGPAPYLGEERWPQSLTQRAEAQLMRILLATPAEVLLDHHALRGPEVRAQFRDAYATGRVRSFAQHRGEEERLLEMRREEARGAGPE